MAANPTVVSTDANGTTDSMPFAITVTRERRP